jgi:predicted DNA-binding transcriptional regulator YafY
MSDAILRQWMILSMLPAPPRRIGTAALEAGLRERGMQVHRRTIQRDLIELATIFPIVVDDRGKPYGWRWASVPSLAGRPLPTPSPRMVVRLRAPRAALDSMAACVGISNLRHASGEAEALLDDAPSTRRVLLAFADAIEVVSPPALRAEIRERLRHAIATHD